jgi:hypothetical protein
MSCLLIGKLSVGSACFKFGEADSGLFVECDAAGKFLPAPDDEIAI